jgi:transaldolase
MAVISRGVLHDLCRFFAKHLLQKVERVRPNVMIKVPATPEGIAAIRQLTCEGINVNITLLFALDRYREVVEAYLAGLEARLAASQPIDRIASVASFFLSRIDVLVDPVLEKLRPAGGPNGVVAPMLDGQVAIASAKIAYQIYKEVNSKDRASGALLERQQ